MADDGLPMTGGGFSLSDARGRWVFMTDQGDVLIDFDRSARLCLDSPGARWFHVAYCYSGADDNTIVCRGHSLHVRGEDVHLDLDLIAGWRSATREDPALPPSPEPLR